MHSRLAVRVIFSAILAVLAVCEFVAPISASADTRRWISTTSGDWDDASKWRNGIIPEAGDDVIIDLSSADVTVSITSGFKEIRSITCSEGLTIRDPQGASSVGLIISSDSIVTSNITGNFSLTETALFSP